MIVRKYDDKEERIKTENTEIPKKSTVTKNLKKKTISQNKFKNGLLDDHKWTSSGVKKDGTSLPKTGSKYDMPYVPSMKSLPYTSFSDASLILNLKNKVFPKSAYKSSKSVLKQIQNKNLRKLSIANNFFEDVEKYKNTDRSFIDYSNIITNFKNFNFITEERTKVRTTNIELSHSTKITDTTKSCKTITESKATDSIILTSQKASSNLLDEIKTTPKLKINIKKTLDGPFNNKTMQFLKKSSENINLLKIKADTNTNRRENEWKRNDSDKKSSKEYYSITRHKKKQETILVLFDCNKYPLTDSQGKILKTAGGKSLVKYKNGKPYDCFGRAVFDSSGNSSTSSNFKPFSKVNKNKKYISAIPLFDFRGYCLLNYDGSSLKNADGKDLVQVDEEGQVLHDINKHPIFDNHGIPITKQNGLWLSPKGAPVRIFDKTKHPLTNKQGRPLEDIKCRELVKCDQHRRPLIDYNDNYVFDALGISAVERKFNPSLEPEKSGVILIAMLQNKPAQLFDKKGWPLTEKNGVVMTDSSGKCLLMLKKVYPNEITDYDQLLFRLNEPVPLTEICLYLPETKLTSEEEYIDIKENDEIRERRKIVLDFVGHPLSDRFKGRVLDKNGRKIFLNITSYFVTITDNPSSSTVCMSNDGITIKTLKSCHKKLSQNKQDNNSVVSFQTETDLFGRPLYNSLNHPLFDKYGRPIYDLFGRCIYDMKGSPIATAEAKRLDNGLDEPPGIKIDFKLSCLIPQNPNNLPNVSDLNGGPIFDSLGFPLYNQKGKPLIDAYGRPLYDEIGIPLCDKDGRPASKLVKQKHKQISSVEDKIEMLQLSPTETETKETSFGDGISTQYKRIQEIAKNNKNEDFITKKSMQNFIARIRITTFFDGEKYFEILESVPYSLSNQNENLVM